MIANWFYNFLVINIQVNIIYLLIIFITGVEVQEEDQEYEHVKYENTKR